MDGPLRELRITQYSDVGTLFATEGLYSVLHTKIYTTLADFGNFCS